MGTRCKLWFHCTQWFFLNFLIFFSLLVLCKLVCLVIREKNKARNAQFLVCLESPVKPIRGGEPRLWRWWLRLPGCFCLLSHGSLPVPYPTSLYFQQHLLRPSQVPMVSLLSPTPSHLLCSVLLWFQTLFWRLDTVLKVQKLSLGFICVAVLFAGNLGIELGALHGLGNYCTTELCLLPLSGLYICCLRQSPAM